jgi:hypothetical protein
MKTLNSRQLKYVDFIWKKLVQYQHHDITYLEDQYMGAALHPNDGVEIADALSENGVINLVGNQDDCTYYVNAIGIKLIDKFKSYSEYQNSIDPIHLQKQKDKELDRESKKATIIQAKMSKWAIGISIVALIVSIYALFRNTQTTTPCDLPHHDQPALSPQ